MNTNTVQHTAKIYQFPVRPHAGIAAYRGGSADAAELMVQRISDAVESCWYHDAAIKQSAISKKP